MGWFQALHEEGSETRMSTSSFIVEYFGQNLQEIPGDNVEYIVNNLFIVNGTILWDSR